MNKSIDKILFCYYVTADIFSFTRLLWNSKRLRWSKSAYPPKVGIFPEEYKMNIGNQKRSVWLRTYDGDIDIFYELFWKKIYEIAPGILEKCKVIVDLGSNIGLSVLYFVGKTNAEKIICVEPDPENYKMLIQNVAIEIRNGRVMALEAAVMHSDGTVGLESNLLKYNTKVVEIESGEIRAVSMMSLFNMYSIDRINLLKIDIEGSEKYIFSGNMAWLDRVDNIIVEFHSEEDQRIGSESLKVHHFELSNLQVEIPDSRLLLAIKTK